MFIWLKDTDKENTPQNKIQTFKKKYENGHLRS